MAKIFFIRHAESIANTKGIYQGQSYDTELSVLGKKQAKLLAERLVKENLTKVYSSPLKRARKTAESITQITKNKLIVDDELLETNHGDWEGKRKQDIENFYKDLYKMWRTYPSMVIFPNGEPFVETINRVKAWYKRFISTVKKSDNIAIVTHSNILQILYCQITLQSFDRIWDLTVEAAAIAFIVEYSTAKIVKVNDNDHLNKLPNTHEKHAI